MDMATATGPIRNITTPDCPKPCGEWAGLRQATISLSESGEKSAKLGSILAVLGALNLEFRIGEHSKGQGGDIEELF